MSAWGGAEALAARAKLRPAVAAGLVPCCRCNRPIRLLPGVKGEGWQVDHWPVPREFGGTHVAAAHARCNLRAGGKRGAAITNAKRRTSRPARNRANNIRGL